MKTVVNVTPPLVHEDRALSAQFHRSDQEGFIGAYGREVLPALREG